MKTGGRLSACFFVCGNRTYCPRRCCGEGKRKGWTTGSSAAGFPPLEPRFPWLSEERSALPQSDYTTECIFNGAAELLKRLGGAYYELPQLERFAANSNILSRTAKRLRATLDMCQFA